MPRCLLQCRSCFLFGPQHYICHRFSAVVCVKTDLQVTYCTSTKFFLVLCFGLPCFVFAAQAPGRIVPFLPFLAMRPLQHPRQLGTKTAHEAKRTSRVASGVKLWQTITLPCLRARMETITAVAASSLKARKCSQGPMARKRSRELTTNTCLRAFGCSTFPHMPKRPLILH